MKTIIPSFAILISLFLTTPSFADVQFEGWYRVLVNGKHAGFVIQRYETDPQSKKKTISYFVRFKRYGEFVQQAIRAEADENFKPIKYQNFSDLASPSMAYEGEFGKNETRVSTYDVSGKTRRLVSREPYSNPDQAILSSFLFPILDKKGELKVGTKGSYNGFSEENGNYGTGEYEVLATKVANGIPVSQVVDDFQSEAVENFVFAGGQSLGSRSASNKTRVYLVRDQSEAIAGIEFTEKTEAEIRKFFNGIPEGKKNPVTEGAGAIDAYKFTSEFKEHKASKLDSDKGALLSLPKQDSPAQVSPGETSTTPSGVQHD